MLGLQALSRFLSFVKSSPEQVFDQKRNNCGRQDKRMSCHVYRNSFLVNELENRIVTLLFKT